MANAKATLDNRANHILLGIIAVFLGMCAMSAWSIPAPIPTPLHYAQAAPHSAQHNRYVIALDKLNAVEVHCPSFLDAPLGIKPCPAQELLDAAKDKLQTEIDSTY